MVANKGRAFPIIITCLLIMIIIYLFANVEQPYVTCSKSFTNDLGIRIVEDFNVDFEGNRIDEVELRKVIVFPGKYLDDETHLNSLKFLLEKHYDYLGRDKVSYSSMDDRLIVDVEIDDDFDAIVLNNIDFFENEDLEIRVNSNTRSSDVVTIGIGDKYTEGEFITRMRNNGYICK